VRPYVAVRTQRRRSEVVDRCSPSDAQPGQRPSEQLRATETDAPKMSGCSTRDRSTPRCTRACPSTCAAPRRACTYQCPKAADQRPEPSAFRQRPVCRATRRSAPTFDPVQRADQRVRVYSNVTTLFTLRTLMDQSDDAPRAPPVCAANRRASGVGRRAAPSPAASHAYSSTAAPARVARVGERRAMFCDSTPERRRAPAREPAIGE
jgi:hypothetical protein